MGVCRPVPCYFLTSYASLNAISNMAACVACFRAFNARTQTTLNELSKGTESETNFQLFDQLCVLARYRIRRGTSPALIAQEPDTAGDWPKTFYGYHLTTQGPHHICLHRNLTEPLKQDITSHRFLFITAQTLHTQTWLFVCVCCSCSFTYSTK